MGSPVASSTPYVPSSRRCSAASISARSTSSPSRIARSFSRSNSSEALVGRVLVVVRQVARLRGLLLVETLAAQLRDELADPGRVRARVARAACSSTSSWSAASVMRRRVPIRPAAITVGSPASLVQAEPRAEVDDALGEQGREQPRAGTRRRRSPRTRCASSGPMGASAAASYEARDGIGVERRRRRRPAGRCGARARSTSRERRRPRASRASTSSGAGRADRRARRPRRAGTGSSASQRVDAHAAHARPSRARSGRRAAPPPARRAATVATSKRVSPPPTSLPRSMSTTPNSRSPSRT